MQQMSSLHYKIEVIPEYSKPSDQHQHITEIFDIDQIAEMIMQHTIRSQFETLNQIDDCIDNECACDSNDSVFDELYEMYAILTSLMSNIARKVGFHFYTMIYYIFSGMMVVRIMNKIRDRKVRYTVDDMKKRV